MPQPAIAPDFRQHLTIETPEHVALDYEIAGIGSRALAAVIDMAILAGTLIAAQIAFALLGWLGLRLGISAGWFGALALGLLALLFAGYFAFFEGLRGGQTPGKRKVGIRVVLDTGHPVTFTAAAVRNLVRMVDFAVPPPYFLGAVLVALHPRAKRLGDLVAGTVVVRDQPIARAAQKVETTAVDETLAAPEIADPEFALLGRFVERAQGLAPEVRTRIAGELAVRFAAQRTAPASTSASASAAQDDAAFLEALHADEAARRRGRMAGRGVARAPGARLAEQKRGRWTEFQVTAERVARGGLDVLRAEELPDFAARYREVAADLARLRTYRADPVTIAYVGRLAAAGHNALYRDERQTLRRIWTAVAREWPGAVVEARRYVLVAMLAFALPTAVGYRVLREQPALAEEVLPDVLLARAEAGAARAAHGRKYVEIEAGMRPLAATGIIANNVRVAVMCFAGGALAGVGALVLLAFNGLQIGAAAGHFANTGLLGYLLEFMIGHGALELFAIWVAGAAGFLLGRSILAPGELTRGDALVVNGRLAARMVGAASVCLLVAGLIEGFVSTGRGDVGERTLASAVSLLFLCVYLASGVAGRRAVAGPAR